MKNSIEHLVASLQSIANKNILELEPLNSSVAPSVSDTSQRCQLAAHDGNRECFLLFSRLILITLQQRGDALIPDQRGVKFLQWCLPRLHLHWHGFRKVRRQIYKRIARRMTELALSDIEGYRKYLESHPEEWKKLDTYCWISISRFYRDRRVFEQLENEYLPVLTRTISRRGECELRCWSAGCAAGEEPYTLALLFHYGVAPRFPMIRLHIIATDADPTALRRAERGCYPASSLKDLPDEWWTKAFDRIADNFCLKAEYRRSVSFALQDIRERAPEGSFHLILCRNLVFTYFDAALQKTATESIARRLLPDGILVVGKGETIPAGPWGLEPWQPQLGIFRKVKTETGNSQN